MAQQSLFIDQLRLNADVAILRKAPLIYRPNIARGPDAAGCAPGRAEYLLPG
jgi:hypothetical protein